ncbi:Nucleotidyltransferase, partial [Rhizoclosmatium globosum]
MQSQNRRPLSYSAVVALTPPTPPSASTTTTTSTSNASSSDGSAVQGHAGSEDQSTTSTTTSHQTATTKENHGNNLKHKQSIQRLIKSGLDHSEEEAESGAQEPTHPLSPSPSPSPSLKTTTQHHTNNQQHSHKRAPRDVSLKVKPSGQLRFNIEKLDQEDLEAVSGLVSFDSPTPIRTYPMHLPPLVEQQLDKEIEELYMNLQPREIDTQKRRDFVIKIQTLVGIEWPDRDIQVHAFGSSVNGLGSADSDVDLCFTTSWKDTQRGVSNMFVLAAFFKKYGMTRIYTVSKAKVPICKFYDPEFNLACDVNINNIIALRNTELIKSYVDMDDRVRPFIMVIKYWAKMRALNDAAKGGTLSSYCWVLMCLNFLQTRSPPILPSLQKPYLDQLFSKPAVAPPQPTRKIIPATIIDGVDCSFDRDAEPLSTRNTAGLADLVYTFFRHYAVEFSYPTSVVSTRHGAVLSKREKGWDVDVDRYCRWLCVEEVFGVERNLANSADGVAVAGLRGEMRRAVEGVL